MTEFSAYFLTCMLSAAGSYGCNVAYTQMEPTVQDQSQCDEIIVEMHEYVLEQIATEFPTMTVVREEHGCYPGLLSAGEVARDEHAKLLSRGIDASLSDIP